MVSEEGRREGGRGLFSLCLFVLFSPFLSDQCPLYRSLVLSFSFLCSSLEVRFSVVFWQ